MPIEYWCMAAKYAVWSRNRVLTSALPFSDDDGKHQSGIVPLVVYANIQLDFNKLKVFGCAAMPIQLKEKQPIGGKFMPRFQTTNFIFVGMKG